MTNCLPSCGLWSYHKETPCIKAPIFLCLRFQLRNVHLLIKTLANQFRNLHSIRESRFDSPCIKSSSTEHWTPELWKVNQTFVVTLNCIVHWSFLKSVAGSKIFKFNTNNLIAHNWWCLRRIIIYSSDIENVKEHSIISVKEIQTNNERMLLTYSRRHCDWTLKIFCLSLGMIDI